eukprot:g1373.t1
MCSALGVTTAKIQPRQTIMWDGKFLQRTKQLLHRSSTNSTLQSSLKTLIKFADYWKNESDHNNTFTVMTKPFPGPSGDKHDFYSLGTYWWPNPNTTNGLPYIRKDGLVNPETFLYDSVPLSQMIMAVKNLSLAYYFTDNVGYCEGAVSFIDTWFLSEGTRMNPTQGLQYAQLIKGVDEGRGIGIIDAKDLAFVFDSALLLTGCYAWEQRRTEDINKSRKEELWKWLQTYCTWLGSSKHASDEFDQLNNHGTWFDVQALSLSLHIGNRSWAKILANNSMVRVGQQVAENGTLPLELSRTRAMHYTWWDLQAFFELSHLVKQV